jgi:hypothetical protein
MRTRDDEHCSRRLLSDVPEAPGLRVRPFSAKPTQICRRAREGRAEFPGRLFNRWEYRDAKLRGSVGGEDEFLHRLGT